MRRRFTTPCGSERCVQPSSPSSAQRTRTSGRRLPPPFVRSSSVLLVDAANADVALLGEASFAQIASPEVTVLDTLESWR
jgi:hypothetical protein